MTETLTRRASEPMLITRFLSERIRVQPMYFELGFSSRKAVYARAAVVERLLLALDHLPDHLGFLIWDAYRPRAVQASLFVWMQGEIRKRQPSLTDEAVIIEAKKYMSAPSVVGEAYCPPHLSGGAIDLTLFNVNTGETLPMGTPFDDCTERAHALHFEGQAALSLEDEACRLSRAALRKAMLAVGFTPYEYEWWHFDYGDCFWSRQTGQPALFGSLFGDAEWPAGE